MPILPQLFKNLDIHLELLNQFFCAIHVVFIMLVSDEMWVQHVTNICMCLSQHCQVLLNNFGWSTLLVDLVDKIRNLPCWADASSSNPQSARSKSSKCFSGDSMASCSPDHTNQHFNQDQVIECISPDTMIDLVRVDASIPRTCNN